MERLDEVSEECLQEGETRPANHAHRGVTPTDESLSEHLTSGHGMDIPHGLSLGTLQGMHDRFHGEAHAADD